MKDAHVISRSLVAISLLGLALLLVPASLGEETGMQVEVETFTLDNGLTFLLVEKPEMTTIAAAWVAHVGSSNERPGITGISHLFEHMMFKGTHTIGTTDIKRDLEIIAEQEALQDKIRALYVKQRERARLGEIDDPFDPENRTAELVELEQEFEKLVDAQREILIGNDFDKIYTRAGAARMNAFTTEDLTGYFINVPANKIELWFWLESDRLANPVFREFYSERAVVYEERRMRTESSPTGEFDEQFEAMFWESHPYSWPVVGWPSDLEVITKEQADNYFDTYYAPNNLTAVLVGNFDSAEVKKMATSYFGRLERGKQEPSDVATLEMEQRAEKRMIAECDCQPQISIMYHTKAFRHKDSYALDVLSELLNGRTGRLYKAMVLGDEIASSAFASQDSRKWGGLFSFSAETKGDATPAQLEQAWYAVLDELRNEPIPATELKKVKNQITADSFRQLESPFFLMIQLLFYDGLGDWQYLNYNSEKTLAVTADDVKRVANTYFTKQNRAVGTYHRKTGTAAAEIPPEVAALPDQMREMIMAQIKQIQAVDDPAQLEQALGQIEQQKGNVPPEFEKVLPVMENIIRERIAELQSSEGEGQ
jgi:predicted Zn-dependent peptidase